MRVITVLVMTLAYTSLSAEISPSERTVEFTYGFTIQNIPVDAQKIIAWVPIPYIDEY
ncbi:MAG: hypothetical protein GKR87_09400 [Kiritimatiellae bacterium]|nr:hypothetical protein [Kiritimatiellia bacterium]